MSLPDVKAELDNTEFCSWCEHDIDWNDPMGEIAVRYYWNQFNDRVRVVKHQECYEQWLRLAEGPLRLALGEERKTESKALSWMMLVSGPGRWKFVKAEGPCWKVDLTMSFRWFTISIGWQKEPPKNDPLA